MILESPHTRRSFLSGVAIGSGLLTGGCNRSGQPVESPGGATPGGPADVTLRIGPVLADIAKDHTISTIGYNGAVPGPLIRLREGVPVTVDLFNETDTPELVHWHGQIIPAAVDGAEEEKSLAVPAHGHMRYRLTPQPAGARFVHSHVMSMSDLTAAPIPASSPSSTSSPRTTPGSTTRRSFWRRTNLSRSSRPRRWRSEEDAERRASRRRPAEGRKAERVGDRIPAVHHQRQVPGLWRARSRQRRAARLVPHPECQRHREHSARAAGPPVSGDRPGWQSRAATASR